MLLFCAYMCSYQKPERGKGCIRLFVRLEQLRAQPWPPPWPPEKDFKRQTWSRWPTGRSLAQLAANEIHEQWQRADMESTGGCYKANRSCSLHQPCENLFNLGIHVTAWKFCSLHVFTLALLLCVFFNKWISFTMPWNDTFTTNNKNSLCHGLNCWSLFYMLVLLVFISSLIDGTSYYSCVMCHVM